MLKGGVRGLASKHNGRATFYLEHSVAAFRNKTGIPTVFLDMLVWVAEEMEPCNSPYFPSIMIRPVITCLISKPDFVSNFVGPGQV